MKKILKFIVFCFFMVAIAGACWYFFEDEIVQQYEEIKKESVIKDSIFKLTKASVVECESKTYFNIGLSENEEKREYTDRRTYIIDQENGLYQHITYFDQKEDMITDYTCIVDYENPVATSVEGEDVYNEWFYTTYDFTVSALDLDNNEVYHELKPDSWSCMYDYKNDGVILGYIEQISFGKLLENVGVEIIGEEDCNGVKATHYRLQMDFSEEYHYGPGDSFDNPLIWAQFFDLYCLTDDMKKQYPEECNAIMKMTEDYVSSCYDIWISEDGYMIKLQKDESVEFYYSLTMGNPEGAVEWFSIYGTPKIINEQIYKYNQDAKQIQLPAEYVDLR